MRHTPLDCPVRPAPCECRPHASGFVEAKRELASGAFRQRIAASALADLDTAAIAVLLDCRRQAQAAGKTLQVVGAPAKLAQLATLYGVADLLALQPGAA